MNQNNAGGNPSYTHGIV